MGLNEARHDKLRRLASRICAGEVVFFIGAGFSLDSEGNSAKLLIARLLARFEALTDWMLDLRDADANDAAKRLKRGLRVTFSLIDPATRKPTAICSTTSRGLERSHRCCRRS
jgi:hypothetical protein